MKEDPVKQVVLEYMQLDLSSFQSTKAFILAFKERNLPLNILINNAGIAWVPLSKYPSACIDSWGIYTRSRGFRVEQCKPIHCID